MTDLFSDTAPVPPRQKSVEWYTPPWVFDALGLTFDLDPASPLDAQTFVPASNRYTREDNGLSMPWFGRVWLNPPYGSDTAFWMRRMIAHDNGIALVFSRTDAAWCQQAMQTASAILFLAGRIEFIPGRENRHKESRSGAGTVLFAFGDDCARALSNLQDRGTLLVKSEPAA
jgi:hypothetical protein